jgi:hypothetical protein
MKNLFTDPKTTIGGLIALAGVIIIIANKDLKTGLSLIGLAASWIGIASKDSSSINNAQNIADAETSDGGSGTGSKGKGGAPAKENDVVG